jgi:hypothetical protein
MKRLVKFPLEEGQFLLVEVEEPESVGEVAEGGVVPAGRAKELAIAASLTFDEALETLGPAVNQVIAKLRELVEKPDAVSLEFGLKLNGKLGAIVASTSLEGNFQVKLKWQKPPVSP